MYHFFTIFLTFCIALNALFTFLDQDLNLFNVNDDSNENWFLDTIPADELLTPDASSATLVPDQIDPDSSPGTQNDFLAASNDECLSSSTKIFSSSTIFRTRSLPIKKRGRGRCFLPDGPEGADLGIEDLNVGEGVSEYWCPTALLPALVAYIGGLPLIPVCWTPGTILMPSSWLNTVYFTSANGEFTWWKNLEDCTLRKFAPTFPPIAFPVLFLFHGDEYEKEHENEK